MATLNDVLVNCDEAAPILDKHPSTLRRWCAEGRIRSERVGKIYLLYRDDVERIRQQQVSELREAAAKLAATAPTPGPEQATVLRDALPPVEYQQRQNVPGHAPTGDEAA